MIKQTWTKLRESLNTLVDTDKPNSGKEDTLSPSQARLQRFFHHYKLSDLLPYETYNPDTRLFGNTDSLGFAFDLAPLTSADEETIRLLAGLFTQGLPTGTCLQFTLFASPNVMPKLMAWAQPRHGGSPKALRCDDHDNPLADGRYNQRDTDNIYCALARNRVGYLSTGLHHSLLSDQPVLVRDYRLIVSVSLPKPQPSNWVVAEAQAVQLRESLLGSLKTAGLQGRVMTADDFVDVMDDIVNPRHGLRPKRHAKTWDQYELIRDQLVAPDTQLLVGRDSLKLRNAEVRCCSVRHYPNAWALWAMGDLLGDFFQDALRLPCPFLMTTNIYLPDQTAEKNRVKLKAARATQATESAIGRYVPVWKDKKREWDFVNQKVSEGHTLCRVNHQILLFSEPGSGADNILRSMVTAKGWEFALDRFVMVNAFLGALPLMLSQRFAGELDKLGRMRTMLTWTVANLLPVVGEWKGQRQPVLQLLGRRGQLHGVDIFDNPQGNFNAAVAAVSGAGKSFLVQELALSVRSLGGRVWIIDVGRSYECQCRLIGGLFLEFGAGSTINLNPFTHIHDWEDEGLPLLKPLLAQMASPSQPVSDIQAAFLEQALKHAWQQHGNEATITPVAAFLLDHSDERARDLGVQLYPYTQDGMYAKYFEGPSTLNFDNPFVVLELGDLANKKDLQSVVLLILMMQIAQAMYLGDRSVRKLCIIDEAWRLMAKGYASEFIEEGYRVARKHGGAFVTITQGINDYYKSDTARAALENADWLFLLRQKKESIAQLENSDRLLLNDYMKKALKSVKTEKQKYAEIMVCGPGGWSIGRLIVDPFAEKLYSTESDEFEAIKRCQANGATLTEAIAALVKESRR